MAESPLQRVTALGGIFFKAKDPAMLREWYRQHLGIDVQVWGGAVFPWASPENPAGVGQSVWSVMDATSSQCNFGAAPFMINYRVADLHAVLAALRAEGCQVDEKVDESEYGKFGWVTDPEGNRCELWQPPEGQ